MERGIRSNAAGLHIGKSGGKIGLFGATPVSQQTNLADIAVTYTANDPSITANGAITVADGSTPTVDELLEFCVENMTRINALSAQLQNLGAQATS